MPLFVVSTTGCSSNVNSNHDTNSLEPPAHIHFESSGNNYDIGVDTINAEEICYNNQNTEGYNSSENQVISNNMEKSNSLGIEKNAVEMCSTLDEIYFSDSTELYYGSDHAHCFEEHESQIFQNQENEIAKNTDADNLDEHGFGTITSGTVNSGPVNRTVNSGTVNSDTDVNKERQTLLEEFYLAEKYPSSIQIKDLSDLLKVNFKFLKTWFRHKRQKDTMCCGKDIQVSSSCGMNSYPQRISHETVPGLIRQDDKKLSNKCCVTMKKTDKIPVKIYNKCRELFSNRADFVANDRKTVINVCNTAVLQQEADTNSSDIINETEEPTLSCSYVDEDNDHDSGVSSFCANSLLSPRQEKKLCEVYRTNRNPSTSELRIIAQLLDMTMRDVAMW